jgi:WD40 repeat protein
LCICISPDGKIIAAACEDKVIRLWDIESGGPVGIPLKGHTKKITNIYFSPDGKVLFSSADDGTVRLWNMSNHTNL